MSSKKDFDRKQQLKSTKCPDRDYFCDTLDEIMLVREAVEFNSSMEPTNAHEFYMAFKRICKMFLYLSARTLTTICPCLDVVVKLMIVDDCIFCLHEHHNNKSLCHFDTSKTHLF